MVQLEWSERSLFELDQLILSHNLPTDTRDRVEDSAWPLAQFPRFGPAIRSEPDGAELRFLIGPWPWLVIVYVYLQPANRVVVASVEDGRSATATITREPRSPK